MKTHASLVAASLFASFCLTGQAQAQKKPAAGKPGASKPAPAKPGGPVVLGTQQLPGDFGKLGTTYTIGKSAPLNFTLKSAEYSIAPFNIGPNATIPKVSEKLLILHYTIQNPQPREQRYYWGELSFTAVDKKDVNHEFIQATAREGEKENLSVDLKPAQKIDVMTAIVVPAEGEVPKLIVQREPNAPVIRYDLRGKVKALTAPIADPADTTGATARSEVPAEAGVYYPIGVFEVKLDQAATTTEALGGKAPEEGKRYVTAVFTIKNALNAEQRYYWGEFEAVLRDANGEKVAYNQTLLKASRDEKAESNLKPGEEARVRFFFELPSKVAPKSISLANVTRFGSTDARAFVFDVSVAK